jgi:hypothetical protein
MRYVCKSIHDAPLAMVKIFLRCVGISIMMGSLNMGGQSVSNVPKPISAQNVVTKNYTYSLIESSHLDMKGNKVTNMEEPFA